MSADVEVTEDELAAYNRALTPYFPMPDQFVPVVWHYTGGDAMVSIISSSVMWTTHVSCMNDHSEFRYGLRLLRNAVRVLRERQSDPRVAAMLMVVENSVGDDVSITQPWFVSSFSASRDDLAQWRAYGGGEGGYALGFNFPLLVQACNRSSAILVPVCYDPNTHAKIAMGIAELMAEQFVVGLKARPSCDLGAWTQSFLKAWGNLVAPFAVLLKDPCFRGEREWRLIRSLYVGEHPNLIFRQRQTMLARHLPLRVGHQLPLAEVMIGPSRHQAISKVAVHDLLEANGYRSNVPVSCSQIPLQAT
jgi:hypothetical protein